MSSGGVGHQPFPGLLLGPLRKALLSILLIACPVKVFLLTRTCGGIIRMFVIRLLSLAVSHSSRLTGDRYYISMPIASSTYSELIHLQIAL